MKVLQYTVLTVYLCISSAGLLYTFFRIDVPFIRPLARYSYQMMAPYQGYNTHAKDILLEGQQPDGSWQRIDLDTYFPHGTGERSIRVRFYPFPEEVRKDKYEELARHILRLEEEYRAVRLSMQQWPLTAEGYEAGRTPEETETLYSITVP